MTEPTERDRELFRNARQRYHARWMADIGSCVDYGEREMIQAIAAAREEGRQEERAR